MTSPDVAPTILDAARRLTAESVISVTPANAGANSRLFRVDTAAGPRALKSYPTRPGDRRRRADIEMQALTFLRARGLTAAPQPLRHDPQGQFLLMEWIDGKTAGAHTEGDTTDAAEFIAQVFALSAHPDAAALPLASEACLSAATIVEQIESRLAQFSPESEVSGWMDSAFLPLLARTRQSVAAELAGPTLLAPGQRRLIPADFGFHNAIRQPDGRLRYIDFDYFGWDDPVKLAADIYLHPAMNLTPADVATFFRAMRRALPDDDDFPARLNRHLPLYAVRWALIVLNVFRGDRLQELPPAGAARTALRDARIQTAQTLLAKGQHFDVKNFSLD
ncbi:MAG: aminoglycoside phosphotransferase family protein [Pseudolabrys sp.]|nr:aminoglycoside phosphotransferase family protein [Pseudolabrys sp.]MDP2295743.1 aminoglycoside phosphotransferase family protein [Pseudolabrys sp.]